MRSAFGSIRVRGDTCQIRWTDGGVQHSATVRGSRVEAAKELARIQLEIEGVGRDLKWGKYWELRVKPSLTEVEPTTAADYERSWRRLAPHIAERWVSQTTPRMVETVVGRYERGTSMHDARLWRKMCRMAVADGALARDPFEGLRLKAAKKREKRLPDAGGVLELLEAIRGIKYEPVLLCELGGGLRHEEACALTWEDVEAWEHGGRVYAVLSVSKALTLLNGHKYLKAPKTALSGREVVLGEPFASRLLALRGTGPLVPSGVIDSADPAAPYTSPMTITHNWKDWCEDHGVDYLPPKDMRSTFATLHGEAGSPDSLVSGAMGHAGETTKTRNYQQMTRRGGALIADNLAEHLERYGRALDR